MQNRVYVSCPMSVSQTYLDLVVNKLTSMGFDVSYWDRGTPYSSTTLNNSDIFVLIPPNNKWEIPEIATLPKGTFSELLQAINDEKPLYMAYTLSDRKTIHIYQAEYDEDDESLIGVKGSAENITNLLKKFPKVEIFDFTNPCDEVLIKNIGCGVLDSDVRLLLAKHR